MANKKPRGVEAEISALETPQQQPLPIPSRPPPPPTASAVPRAQQWPEKLSKNLLRVGVRRQTEQPPPGNLLTPSGAGKTGHVQVRSLPEMSAATSDSPLQTTLERLLAILEKTRRRDGRPEDLKKMTADQVSAEKKALQIALLQLQRRHGRPFICETFISHLLQQSKQDKETAHPLYERYRMVKQLIGREGFRNTDEEDSSTSPEESPPNLISPPPAEPTFSPSPLTEDTDSTSPPHLIVGANTSQDGMAARTSADERIKTGNLVKSSGTHMGIHMGERRFRLTEEALEYFQHFSHVKVRRSFPLTSIEKIEYDPDIKEPGPKVFKLLFSTYVMTLQAETREDAKDWVEKIENAWKMWQVHPASKHTRKPRLEPRESSLSLPPLSPAEPLEETVEEEEKGKNGGEEQMPLSLPPAATTPPQEEDKPKNKGRGKTIFLHRRNQTCISDPRQESSIDKGTHNRRKAFGRRGTKLWSAVKLAPIIAKQFHHARGSDKMCVALHEEYPMIKYPRRDWALPSEKLFKIDSDNLQILWRQNQASSFKYSKSLSLHRILEIREGQQTAKFDKFPYDEVWGRSFSLVYEGVKKGGKYVGLTALDLICDGTDSFKEWSQGVKSLVSGFHVSSFPFQHNNTDPTILWMKQLWSCYSIDHEITEKTAIKLVRRFKPTLTGQEAKTVVKEAHAHQVRHTVHHGNAIRWDGFVAIFNLLCEQSEKLFSLFQKYAKRYPQLGMTPEEFKTFLISECYWDPKLCTQSEIHQLVYQHDYHHQAFKKFVAQNKPSNFHTVSELLSYAGFLSFLRSKDNSAVNVEHNTVYQDMDQPLSHYFINSSHNTYLEEDQLYGRSSTDAYIRTLLQGCRCVEIDCWDDTLRVMGLGEPIIYHGYTLTTKLAFRDVIQTIKDYAFNFSNYPVIVSIENHCSNIQQVKMAKLFKKVMGNVLVLENLVESQGRDRLPSPQELQGKILLKGSYRKLKGNPKRQRPDYNSPKVSRHTTVATSRASFESGFGSLQSPHNSVTSDPDSDMGEQTMTSQDVDLEGSIVALPLNFDSEEVHDIDRKQVKEWARLAEQGNRSMVFKEDDQELVFATVPKLQRLIPYCRAVSIKPWDWQKQLQTTVSEMFSFGEVSANKHCENSPREMLACSERQLVRTYPKGGRFDSSNYDPIPMWNCGMHMVALNWQYPDMFMHLNQGLFRRNGGCGYILKPEVMRKSDPAGDSTPFLPTMTEPHPDVTPVDLEIELLSGQRLCFWKKKCSTLTVEIHTYGIPHDTDKMQPLATAQDNNTFWPQWREGLHIYQKKILMPELCLVYFRVDVVLKGAGLGAKAQLYGQNCISLVSLMPGIKFIPLRTPGGELILESGLFVQIKKRSSLTHLGSVAEVSPQVKRSEMLDKSESTEQFFGDVSVTESINPSLLRERQTVTNHSDDDDDDDVDPTPLNSPRRQSCPVALGTHLETEVSWKSQLDELVRESRSSGREKQLDVIAEVHSSEAESDSATSNKKVVSVSIEPQASFKAGDEERAITVPFDLGISTTDTQSDII